MQTTSASQPAPASPPPPVPSTAASSSSSSSVAAGVSGALAWAGGPQGTAQSGASGGGRDVCSGDSAPSALSGGKNNNDDSITMERGF